MTRSKAARARAAASPSGSGGAPATKWRAAGVEGDGEVGIVFAGDRGGEIGGVGEAVEIDPPALDLPLERERQHLVRPLAHGGRAQQAADRFGSTVTRAQNFPRSRPTTVERSFFLLGAPSGVK